MARIHASLASDELADQTAAVVQSARRWILAAGEAVGAAAGEGSPPPQLFRCEDGAVGMRGECERSFAVDGLLRLVEPDPNAACLLVDMSEVRYMHHRALAAHAQAHRVPLVLRSAPPIVARLVRLMPAGSLRISEEASVP